jgi:hypothetical protein
LATLHNQSSVGMSCYMWVYKERVALVARYYLVLGKDWFHFILKSKICGSSHVYLCILSLKFWEFISVRWLEQRYQRNAWGGEICKRVEKHKNLLVFVLLAPKSAHCKENQFCVHTHTI